MFAHGWIHAAGAPASSRLEAGAPAHGCSIGTCTTMGFVGPVEAGGGAYQVGATG